jgi:hypothetical protein
MVDVGEMNRLRVKGANNTVDPFELPSCVAGAFLLIERA